MTTEKLLKQKDITPIEKLMIMDMMNFPSILNYNKTSAEIAVSIGVKQKDVRVAINCLEEKGLIKSKVSYRSRITTMTNDLKMLLSDEVTEDKERESMGFQVKNKEILKD